jgi:rieske iron-sulfur protein
MRRSSGRRESEMVRARGESSHRCRSKRRGFLKLLAGLGLLPRLVVADEVDPGAASVPPAPGDRLVFALGERAGEAVAPEDLDVAMQQVFAYPQDPATGQIRNGTRLNQVVLVRLDEAALAPATLERAVAGVVAYSGVCSHTGCDVTDWLGDVEHFKCPCHESEFDPHDAARVVAGPAPWQLAALPLTVVDGKLAVARAFEGRVGFLQPGLDPFGQL